MNFYSLMVIGLASPEKVSSQGNILLDTKLIFGEQCRVEVMWECFSKWELAGTMMNKYHFHL